MNDRQLARAVVVTVVALVSLYLVYQMRSVIASLFVSIFLAVALAPAIARVQRIIRSRFASILVVVFLVGLVMTGIALLIIPPIVEGINTVATKAPQWTDDLQHSKWYSNLDQQYQITDRINEFAAKLPSRAGDAAELAKNIAVGAVGAVFQVVVIVVMTVFLLIDGDRIVRWLVDHAPRRRRARLANMVDDIYNAVGGYVAGALSIAFINGVFSFIVMSLLGIPFAATLATVMGFLGLIPLVGASVGGLLITLVALTVNFPTAAIIWALYFLVYQQIENNVLQPFVYKRTVALHPLLVLLAVLIGSSQLGVLGALFAIPIAATAQIVARDWWIHRAPDEEGSLIPLIPAPDEVVEEVRARIDAGAAHVDADAAHVKTNEVRVEADQVVVNDQTEKPNQTAGRSDELPDAPR